MSNVIKKIIPLITCNKKESMTFFCAALCTIVEVCITKDIKMKFKEVKNAQLMDRNMDIWINILFQTFLSLAHNVSILFCARKSKSVNTIFVTNIIVYN